MTSALTEQQPLLTNGTASSEILWDSHSGNTHIEIHVDGVVTHNGVSRREKNGECEAATVVNIPLPPPEKEEPRFPPEKWKTFVAFTFFVGNIILNLTCLAIVHERVPDRTRYPPLPDVFFDLFPPADWALDVSEIIIVVCIWSSLAFIFMHRHRFIILRRVFMIMGLMYFMRSITMFVTQVPIASTTYYCSPKENSTNAALVAKRVLRMLSGFGLSINGQHIYCGDYIYSGHTVILTMSYLVVKEYTPRQYFILHWIWWVASGVGIVFVLLSRGHYTIDVVIAYYVSTRVFWIYHTVANNASLKNASPNNFLSRIWWFPLFSYFEKNVYGVVPRQYEWPLPWPRRCLRRSRIS